MPNLTRLFVIALLLSGGARFAQASRVSFEIQNPETGKPMTVWARSPFKVRQQSKIKLLQNETTVQALNECPYPIVFSNSISSSGYTFYQTTPTAVAISAQLGRNDKPPAIVLSVNANAYVLTHEMQHAVDFQSGLYQRIDAEIAKILHSTTYTDPKLVSAFIEWRGYSKQIAEMQKDRASTTRLLEAFYERGYLILLRALSAQVALTNPASLDRYCEYLKHLLISNDLLTIGYIAAECENRP